MLEQGINRPLTERSEITNTGGLVASPFTGAVNDAVLLFLVAGTVVGVPAYISEVNDANAGTSVTLFKKGVYEVKLYLEQLAAQTSEFGISQDVAAAGLTDDPSFAIAGFLEVGVSTTIAGHRRPLSITTTVLVQPEQEIAGTVIRFHATAGGDAPPAADFEQAAAYYSIRRLNDLHV